jgi:hypothetical protein
MNKYLIAALCLSLNQINAQELEVRDLWFFGKKGIISGGLNPAYQKTTSKVTGNADTDTENFDVNYEIYYSFLDQLKVGLAPKYSYTKDESSDSVSGFVEPTVIVKYRLLDGAEAPRYVDLGFYLSPALGENKDKNQLRGNTQIAISVAAGQKLGNLAYAFSPKVTYQTTTHNENAEDNEAVFFYELPVNAQYDLSDKFSLVGDATYYVIPDQTTSTSTIEYDAFFGVGAGVKYSIIYEMALSVTANYIHAEGDIKIPSTGTYDLKVAGFVAAAKLNFGF